MKKINKIPQFKTYEEEANFWDTHSFTDFPGEFKPVKVVFKLNKPKDESLTVRLQANLKIKLIEVANQAGVNASTLARMWIVEKLRVV
ncbi:hypothetical protein HZB69_03215 [Candidatus Amesbacteria bacterium]|nr:hypothetical protein [Candidatus Amesbacteria bacterium]